jgi:hypothetical protein
MASMFVSTSGNNSNDGLSEAAPKQTLAAAASATSSGDTIYLKRGDTWQEGFGASGASGKHFRAYGPTTSARPLIDGTSSVTAWSLTGTATYTASVVLSETNATTEWPLVLEDGVLLKRQTSLPNCEANPGSYYIASTTMASSPVSVVVHATGSGNPTSNGKAYRVTTRVFGIYGASTIADIEARGFGHNDGSLVGLGNVARCKVYGGGKHLCKDYVAISYAQAIDAHFQTTSGATTHFVIQQDNGTGLTARYSRCYAKQSNGQTINTGQVGFYSHDSVGLRGYDRTDFIDCASVGIMTGFNSDSATVSALRCYTKNAGYPWSGSRVLTVDSCRAQQFSAQDVVLTLAMTSATITNTLITHDATTADTSNACLRTLGGATPVTLENCTFVFSAPASTSNCCGLFDRNAVGTGGITMNRCINLGAKNFKYNIVAPTTYVGDYNVFGAYTPAGVGTEIRALLGTTAYTTLATWQAATSQDSNSVYITFAQQSAFFIGNILDGDYRINPSAQVTGGDGTVYTGTFPDGTPITRCGVQGLPTAWPTDGELLAMSNEETNRDSRGIILKPINKIIKPEITGVA